MQSVVGLLRRHCLGVHRVEDVNALSDASGEASLQLIDSSLLTPASAPAVGRRVRRINRPVVRLWAWLRS